MSSLKKVSAIICTYNRYDLLAKSIESLVSQSIPSSEYEIIVVDNTPNARLEEGKSYFERYSKVPNLTYLFENTPGLSNARNVGIKESSSEIIAFLDDDAIASERWLEEIIHSFASFEKVGVVGGKISPIWELERPAWLDDTLKGYVSVVDWGGRLRIASEDEWFAGANIAFKKSLLQECGGFSTSLGRVGSGNVLLSNEEIQVLNYIKNSGYHSVYSPDACVKHLVEKARISRDWFRRRVSWQAASDFIMNSDMSEQRIQNELDNLKKYLSSLEPLSRNIQGLYQKTDDPGLFRWQLSAIYSMVILNLSGFKGLENE
ncbi:glycosyltransferase family 2 protein [Sessilibacter sp. MAH1]